MGVLRALKSIGQADQERSDIPWASFGAWAPFLAAGLTNGASLDQALTSAAVWACIDAITDPISRTPVDVVRYRDGARQVVEPRPKLIAVPNRTFVTEDVWRTQVGFSMATQGNAFGKVIAWEGTYPSAVQLVDPYSVNADVKDGMKWLGTGGVWGRTWEDGGDWWHIPGRHVRAGSPYGLSPCDYAGETIGLSVAARRFSNEFFSGSGHPTWGFFSDTALSEPQARDIKNAVQAAMRPGSREPLVMGSGLKAQQFSVQPGETQFIDLMRFVNEEAARVWRVPPSAIAAAMSGQSVTYASVGDEDLRKLKDTVEGYLVRIENGLTACLPQPQTVRFNRNAILRGDPKTRHEIYALRLQNKTTTVNEVRRLEDEPPFDDPMYDEPGIPGEPLLPSAPAGVPDQQGTP